MKTAIKQDQNPDLEPLGYGMWVVLENKTNTISHPNIGSLKTPIEEEWNKIFKEFILKACKFIQRCVDTIIDPPQKKQLVAILSKFTVLCQSTDFVVYFLKIKINLVLS